MIVSQDVNYAIFSCKEDPDTGFQIPDVLSVDSYGCSGKALYPSYQEILVVFSMILTLITTTS